MPVRKTIHYHLLHFVLLLIVLTTGGAAVLYLNFDQRLQYLAVMGLGSIYVLWGVLHHISEGTLHPRVLLEYILMAFLCSSILFSIIVRT